MPRQLTARGNCPLNGGLAPSTPRQELLLLPTQGATAAIGLALEREFLTSIRWRRWEALGGAIERPPAVVVIELDGRGSEDPCLVHAAMTRLPGSLLLLLMSATDLDGIFKLPTPTAVAVCPNPPGLNGLLAQIGAMMPAGHSGAPRGGFPLHVTRAIEHIARHYPDPLTRRNIAAAAGITAPHLAELFRRATSSTPHDFVTRLRLEVAKRWLVTTDAKLETIAEAAGFCDASHLFRVFRSRTGMSPGRYRIEGERAPSALGLSASS